LTRQNKKTNSPCPYLFKKEFLGGNLLNRTTTATFFKSANSFWAVCAKKRESCDLPAGVQGAQATHQSFGHMAIIDKILCEYVDPVPGLNLPITNIFLSKSAF
jgi:hypothetical protein